MSWKLNLRVKIIDQEYTATKRSWVMSIQYTIQDNHLSIEAGENLLPIEINIVGIFPEGAGKKFLQSAFRQQRKTSTFIDEFNEPSALIGKPNFSQTTLNDVTAVYTFGVDTRNLVFHRHAGHRIIVGVTGASGCSLKFSLATPEEVRSNLQLFFEKMVIVNILPNRMFTLRFNGNIYHQFCPYNDQDEAFFAVSIHPDETFGLSGELLDQVKNNNASIPLLTEPVTDDVLALLENPEKIKLGTFINLDLEPVKLKVASA